MSTLGKILVPAIAVLLCCTVCYSQDISSDFQQALKMLPEQPKWPSSMTFYDVQAASESFVGKHSDASAVEFLLTKMEDRTSRKLALMCLAKLWQ